MRNLFKTSTALGCALALAACGAATEDEADSVAEAAAGDGPAMDAGKWTSTMTIEKFDIPGAPPELGQMMQGMIGQANTTESCVTEEMAKEGWANRMDEFSGNDECTADSFSADDGKLTGAISCTEGNGTKANMSIDGAYTSSSVEMVMTADLESADIPGGKGTMVMKVASERVGDCDDA